MLYRTLETIVSKYLLPWADRSIEKVINQAYLPHAIIVINQTDTNAVEDESWDPQKTTDAYLKRLEAGFEYDAALKKMADNVLRTGKSITTIRGLLEHYYATVAVVCMPTKTHYNRMDQQTTWLYKAIREKSEVSHHRKAKVRMVPNAERMAVFIRSALDRFADRNDKPFDFLEDGLRENPIIGTFEGNILQLILTFRDASNTPSVRHNVAELFNGVTPIISSCISMDIERENHAPGQPLPTFATA